MGAVDALGDVPSFDAQRGMQFVEPLVVTFTSVIQARRCKTSLVMALAILPATRMPPHDAGEGFVVRQRRATAAEGAQTLRRRKAETGDPRPLPDAPRAHRGPQRQACVFHKHQSMLRRHLRKRGNIRRVPTQVHSQDRRGTRRQSVFDRLWIEVSRVRLDFHPNRLCACMMDRRGRADVAVGSGDHLVARPDS